MKGTRGRIRVAGNRWFPAGRQPFHSPLPKLRHHARKIKELLAGTDPRLRQLYVGQLVILSDPNAQLQDPDQRDIDEVCYVDDLRRRLLDRTAVPSRFDAWSGIGRDPRLVARLTGSARPPTGKAASELGGDRAARRDTTTARRVPRAQRVTSGDGTAVG